VTTKPAKCCVYGEHPQGDLFGSHAVVKQSNEAIVEAFRERLKRVAGFPYVPDPLPMKNRTNAVVYYLFFASQKPVAKKIIDDLFKKYR
jgi:three-Cys-motif partner protein